MRVIMFVPVCVRDCVCVGGGCPWGMGMMVVGARDQSRGVVIGARGQGSRLGKVRRFTTGAVCS